MEMWVTSSPEYCCGHMSFTVATAHYQEQLPGHQNYPCLHSNYISWQQQSFGNSSVNCPLTASPNPKTHWRLKHKASTDSSLNVCFTLLERCPILPPYKQNEHVGKCVCWRKRQIALSKQDYSSYHSSGRMGEIRNEWQSGKQILDWKNKNLNTFLMTVEKKIKCCLTDLFTFWIWNGNLNYWWWFMKTNVTYKLFIHRQKVH